MDKRKGGYPRQLRRHTGTQTLFWCCTFDMRGSVSHKHRCHTICICQRWRGSCRRPSPMASCTALCRAKTESSGIVNPACLISLAPLPTPATAGQRCRPSSCRYNNPERLRTRRISFNVSAERRTQGAASSQLPSELTDEMKPKGLRHFL